MQDEKKRLTTTTTNVHTFAVKELPHSAFNLEIIDRSRSKDALLPRQVIVSYLSIQMDIVSLPNNRRFANAFL